MLGRRFYKTKPCILFQKGRCPRQNCTFAHGEAELRRVGAPPPFNGRRDFRSGDLRDRLERRHSPHRRYSPGRDARGYHAFHGQKSLSHDRGRSLSRSPIRRSDGKNRKRQHFDGRSDNSESFKTSNGDENEKKEDKISSYDAKDALEVELKQIEDDIEKLDDHKSQLKRFLEDKADEADGLNSRIKDLETQLNKEHEHCRRITSKIKKFTKVYGRYLKTQAELKRVQARFQRFGDQLGTDASKASIAEEDSSLNIGSDGEPNGGNNINLKNDELQNHASTARKRPRLHPSISEEEKLGNIRRRDRSAGTVMRSDKLFKSEGPTSYKENNGKETDLSKGKIPRKNFHDYLGDDDKHRRWKNSSPSIASLDKVKDSEAGRALPSTSMAAHAVDELIEGTEAEEKSEAMEGANAVIENGLSDSKANSSYMPPLPLITQNAYKKFEGDDEDVDVEKIEAVMVDVDVNSDVDI